ncbi:hypothetical protein IJT17_03445 [bacterium]|nr:hypothetical protein [bacterium]
MVVDLHEPSERYYLDNDESADMSKTWLKWLDDNGYERYELVNELESVMPDLLATLVPMVGSRGAKVSVWSFYLDCVLEFLCTLPRYRIKHTYSDDVGIVDHNVAAPDGSGADDASQDQDLDLALLPYDDMERYCACFIASLFDRIILIEDDTWWGCCGVVEQLDPWPRNAVEWIIWLTKVGCYVQTDENSRRMKRMLDMMQENAKFMNYPDLNPRAEVYIQIFLKALQHFVERCAWQ